MKVSGFSFVRNAIKYDYPVLESINSVLPLCDEFIIAVGDSEDNTLELIKSIKSDKIKTVNSVWEETREGGKVLAQETDKALSAVYSESDWAFYIQADEVLHEKYLDEVYSAMLRHKDNNSVDGLLFNYVHFYGSYKYIGASSKWYDKEIRIIRPNRGIYSYGDAQGFRKNNNDKLRVKEINAKIYHYGWVKQPEVMQNKQSDFNKLWHDDNWIDKNIPKVAEYDYNQTDKLELFKEEHPVVMQERVNNYKYAFDYDLSRNKIRAKDIIKKMLKKVGINLSYRNYIKV